MRPGGGSEVNLWDLPDRAVIQGEEFPFRGDFRNIIAIMGVLEEESRPPLLRWLIALEKFYVNPVPREKWQGAMEYLARFISGGEESEGGAKLLDWQTDASVIIADVNKAAGRELRSEPFVHWWTFLAFFRAVGEGQLSALVTVRDKLRRGKKLEGWEQEFYRNNRAQVELRPKLTAEERREKERLNQLVGR